MLNLCDETKYIMKKYNIYANKKLGQNFLIDENVVDTIIKKSNITKNDIIIEIGPGLGTLTKKLLEYAKKVICVELDKNMIKILEDRFKLYDNLEIINEDILKTDINSMIKDYKNVKVVANLPYYITTPIIMKLLEDRPNIETITVMVQKEVAERLVSNTGEHDAGAITHTIRYYTEPEIIINVSKDSFIPVPDVESSVIKLKILENPSVKVIDERLLFRIIKTAYMQRRKTFVNAINSIIEKEEAKNILNKMGLDNNIRGEKLTLEQYAQISDYICNQ